MALRYKNRYEAVSVYGNAVFLLRDAVARGGVHLDFGCGDGAIAELLRDELGLTYIGFDRAEDGLDSLRKRGFEAHLIDLNELDEASATITTALAGRPICSITLLDTLGHLSHGEELLTFLRCFAEPVNAPLILSVPNVAHKDLALKLLMGRWDVTESGLLDHTHITLYTDYRLSSLTKTVGWRECARLDWCLYRSDQHFPSSSAALNDRAPLGDILWRFTRQANPNAIVNQFIRLYRVDQPQPQRLFIDPKEPALPDVCGRTKPASSAFLSIIIRTRGTRPATLREALVSLGAQTCQDFEIIIVVRSTDLALVDSVRELAAEFPLSLRSRLRVITCGRPGWSAPLTDALKQAHGSYFAMLDDDNIVFAHWVETFQIVASGSPGELIRARCAQQDFEKTTGEGAADYPLSVSWFSLPWPPAYDPLGHLCCNQTPSISVAYPIEVFRDDGLRFDETLETTEDWDFLVRAAMLRGVSSTPEVTAVCRWWTNGESTLFTYPREFWKSNEDRIRAAFNAAPLLLPPGSASRIVSLIDTETAQAARIEELAREKQAQNNLLERQIDEKRWMALERARVGTLPPWLSEDTELSKLSREVLVSHLTSSSWRATEPLRRIVRWLLRLSRGEPTIESIPASLAERQILIRQIRQSISWRVTLPIRVIGRLLRL